MKEIPPLDWISDCGRYRIKLHRRCFLRMQRVAVSNAPFETGSSLAGRYSDDGHTAVIESISPTPTDSRSTLTSFIRGVFGLRDYFSAVFKRFRGARYRIGEWHSHPGCAPCASGTDDRNQSEIASDNREALPEAILIIVGGRLDLKPTLGVYVYSRINGKIVLRPTP